MATALAGCISRAPDPAGKLYVRSLIDGEDTLFIKGDQMWFVHSAYQVPGKWAGAELPTYINESQEWDVKWNGNLSDIVKIEKAESALPTSGTWDANNMSVKFYTAGYGVASVLEYPSAANNYTLSVKFDDAEPYGAHWYSVDIDWDDTAK